MSNIYPYSYTWTLWKFTFNYSYKEQQNVLQFGLDAGVGQLNGKMFDAIRKLGSYVIKSKRPTDESILIQESKLLDTKKVICIVFELKDDNIIYDNTHLEEYDSSKSGKYLYRTFSHGRYDATPTTRVLSPDKAKASG